MFGIMKLSSRGSFLFLFFQQYKCEFITANFGLYFPESDQVSFLSGREISFQI